jgi:hypothetical protein
MTLDEAILTRLRHLNGWKGPGELAASVALNCRLCVREVPTIPSVKEALGRLVDQGLVESDGQGSWKAVALELLERKPEEEAKAWERRKALVLALAGLLEGTPAGDDLKAVGEGL